jgi:hypothetical protein
MVDYYIDSTTGSIASLTPQRDGPCLVRESGPVALWGTIEEAISEWQRAGSPGIEHFQINIMPESQTIFLPDWQALTWRLPAG